MKQFPLKVDEVREDLNAQDFIGPMKQVLFSLENGGFSEGVRLGHGGIIMSNEDKILIKKS